MSLSYSQLPFGNLHKRAALKSTPSTAPLSATNIVTNPAGMDADAPKSGTKTPLDMGIPAQSPADQSPTEQALGASADQLKLQDDHAKLQADHQKLQQQFDTAKQQALLAKANKPAGAGPKAPSLEKYKSMSMQLMSKHLDRITQNLKGLSDGAGALPMQMKLACAFRALELLEKRANTLPASSMSHDLLADATSGTKNLGAGTSNIAETSDNAQRLSRLTAGPAPGGWVDNASNWLSKQPGGTPFAATLRAAPGIARSTGAVLGGMGDYMARPFGYLFGSHGATTAQLDNNPTENQKDTAALFSTATPKLDQAQELAAQPDATRAAPINYRALDKLDPVARAQALDARQKSLTPLQQRQQGITQYGDEAANDYATHSIGKPLENVLATTQDYYAGAPGRYGVQLPAKGVGPIEQFGRKALDFGTRLPAFIAQRVGDAADRSNTAGQDLSRGQLRPGKDQFGQYHAGFLGNAAMTVGHSALAAQAMMPASSWGLFGKATPGAVLPSTAARLAHNGGWAALETNGANAGQAMDADAVNKERADVQAVADTSTQLNATKGVKNPDGQYVSQPRGPAGAEHQRHRPGGQVI